jgi:translation elongation factor P/translation initiation factor 5A
VELQKARLEKGKMDYLLEYGTLAHFLNLEQYNA